MAQRRLFHGRFKTPRSRAGCVNCRRRKLKCNEEKPQCKRCIDRGEECLYTMKLLWPDENRPRESGNCRKRQRQKQANPEGLHEHQSSSSDAEPMMDQRAAKTSWTGFLNTTSDDLFWHMSGIIPTSNSRMSRPSSSNYDEEARIDHTSPEYEEILYKMVPVHCLSKKVSQTESFLFDFYANRMCPTCSLFDGDDNGYRNVLIPMSVSSPLVMRSVLAVAANHLKLQDPAYHVIALKYKGLTLNSLQRVLSSKTQTISKLEVLCVILMLCFFDISDGCQPDWTRHLDGGSAVMIQPWRWSSLQEDVSIRSGNSAALSFIGQYFAVHNIMAYTAIWDSARELILLKNGFYWLEQINRPPNEIDCYVGCSKELMTVILKICHQVRDYNRRIRTPEQNDSTELLSWKIEMENRIKGLTQVISSHYYCPNPTSNNYNNIDNNNRRVDAVIKTAEAFRLAAMILLQYLNPAQNSFHVQDYVRSILDIMKVLPIDPNGRRSSAIWPYFIASCHAMLDEDRVFVLRRFNRLETQKRFGNIVPVRKVVEQVWKQKDLMADTGIGEADRDKLGHRCFEWENAMAVLGINLSLT